MGKLHFDLEKGQKLTVLAEGAYTLQRSSFKEHGTYRGPPLRGMGHTQGLL